MAAFFFNEARRNRGQRGEAAGALAERIARQEMPALHINDTSMML
jgi:hypothetical protein